MSRLLKKDRDSDITAFGFPQMQREPAPELEIIEEAPEATEEPREPEVSPEEAYRKKLLELERRTQEIEKEAYGNGFAQGEKDGREYGQKAVQVVKNQLEKIVQALETLPADIFRDYRSWLVQTSIRIARHIVGREIRTTPELIEDTVKNLLEEAEEHSTLTVYLNPQDLEFIEKRAEMIMSAVGKRCSMKVDGDLDRGSCRVESSVQLLDSSIESRFEKLEQHLMEALRNEE